MDKDQMKLSDIQRILLGDAPGEFLVEVFFRTIVAYIVMLVIVKLLGKRMSRKLTATEMAVMLMFGAIISGMMQIPDRGVVEGAFVLLLVVGIQRLVTLWTIKNEKFENRMFGRMKLLVKDGVLQLKDLQTEKISRTQLFAMLRSKSCKHLGEIKRLYMETNGSFSIFKNEKERPGVSLYPDEDEPLHDTQQTDCNSKACYSCGMLYSKNALPAQCIHCKGERFIYPVKPE
jgi:uncharacterized membrane protein YcaP (DUF421 family)